MSTRLLFILSLVVAIFAAWFYRNQGELDASITLSKSNIEYQGTDILAIQTNILGMAEYSLIADDLTHYATENTDKLTKMTLNWRPNIQKNITINADKAVMIHDESKVVMTNNIVFVSQDSDKSSASFSSIQSDSSRPPFRLEASELTGDLLNNQLFSKKPVIVKQAENTFEAAGFVADLTKGEYEFDQVAVTFLPPVRQDVALF